LLITIQSDAQKFDEERVAMKERVWKAERDLEVMRQERDKMRAMTKQKEERHNETYLSGWMKNLKPISTAIWGDQRVYGPLVKNINGISPFISLFLQLFIFNFYRFLPSGTPWWQERWTCVEMQIQIDREFLCF
jgi:hypothetical protein